MYALYSTIFPLFVQYLTNSAPALFILQIFLNPAESLLRGQDPADIQMLKHKPSLFRLYQISLLSVKENPLIQI